MATPAARAFVARSPSFTPLPYGLLSTAEIVTGEDHWAAGIIHQAEACEPAGSTQNPCNLGGAVSITKAPTATGIPAMGADPFTVYTYIDCGPIATPDLRERTIAQLERGEGRAVERVFWTGSVTTTGAPLIMPHLAEDAIVFGPGGEISQLNASPVTTGSAVDVVEAIGALDGALGACYGGVGMIHVPLAALAHMKAKGLVCHEDDGYIYTPGGHKIVAGAGYTGSAPDSSSSPAGFAWFYATGNVEVRRGNVMSTAIGAESINKTKNTVTLIAERTYVITWDCCLFGAQVRLGGFDSGSIGSPD